MLLAGDVGGTKTTLGVFTLDGGPRAPIVRATVPSAAYESLEALCQDFLADAGLQVRTAAFGVPGPVRNGVAHATNLPWDITERGLVEALGLERATLVNDLVAVAHGVPQLNPDETCALRAGVEDADGPIAILAPGTGLGVAFAARDGGRYIVHPSEAGHTDFAPTTALQDELLAHMRRTHGHVSFERVCSGLAIPDLYDFLEKMGREAESPAIAAALSTAVDRTPVILEGALDPVRRCGLCVKTLDLFVEILAAKAGSVALTVLATGGVYLGGGLPPRILEALSGQAFEASFLKKGRLRPFLERVPVKVILNPEAAFLGASCRGLEDLLRHGDTGPGGPP